MSWLAGLRALALGLFSALVLGSATLAEPATLDVSLPQARSIALQALSDNNPQLAMQIALGLIRANPKDAFAYFIISSAQKSMGNTALARRAAELAFSSTRVPRQRFDAAQLASRYSYEIKQYTRAQYWLRRSAPYAPSAKHTDIIKRDYAILRQINPWNFQLRFSAAPSSNVNNGSSSPYNIIDGVPLVGLLGGSALALPGTVASADLGISYRLNRSENSETTLGSRLYLQRIWLNAEARAIAPTVSNADLASTRAELSLRHVLRPKGSKNLVSFDLGLGQSWYGGARQYDFARLGLGYDIRLGATTGLGFDLSGERQFSAFGAARDVDLYTLKSGVTHRLGNGDSFGVNLALGAAKSANTNARYNNATAYASYGFARPIGPANVSLLAGVSRLEYPDYSVIFPVPGGRRDSSTFASANFTFEKFGYAGFSPRLSLRTAHTKSNVSRFTTKELSVTLGIASSF